MSRAEPVSVWQVTSTWTPMSRDAACPSRASSAARSMTGKVAATDSTMQELTAIAGNDSPALVCRRSTQATTSTSAARPKPAAMYGSVTLGLSAAWLQRLSAVEAERALDQARCTSMLKSAVPKAAYRCTHTNT
jgi:hypothetical protein